MCCRISPAAGRKRGRPRGDESRVAPVRRPGLSGKGTIMKRALTPNEKTGMQVALAAAYCDHKEQDMMCWPCVWKAIRSAIAEEREANANQMEDIYLAASGRTSCACDREAYERAASDGAGAIRARAGTAPAPLPNPDADAPAEALNDLIEECGPCDDSERARGRCVGHQWCVRLPCPVATASAALAAYRAGKERGE